MGVMAKDGLRDLNTHLFAQIERLGDEALKGDDLDREVRRAAAIVQISGQVIDTHRVQLAARKAAEQYGWPSSSPLALPSGDGGNGKA